MNAKLACQTVGVALSPSRNLFGVLIFFHLSHHIPKVLRYNETVRRFKLYQLSFLYLSSHTTGTIAADESVDRRYKWINKN
jgi:hypothetical protein